MMVEGQAALVTGSELGVAVALNLRAAGALAALRDRDVTSQ